MERQKTAMMPSAAIVTMSASLPGCSRKLKGRRLDPVRGLEHMCRMTAITPLPRPAGQSGGRDLRLVAHAKEWLPGANQRRYFCTRAGMRADWSLATLVWLPGVVLSDRDSVASPLSTAASLNALSQFRLINKISSEILMMETATCQYSRRLTVTA